MNGISRSRDCGIAWILLLVIGGCTLGPEFRAPLPSTTMPVLLSSPPASVPSELIEIPVPEQWWTGFGDPVLASLEERAARANLDIQTAWTRVLESQAQLQIAAGAQYPALLASASYQRERANPNGPVAAPPATSSPSFNAYTAGFAASWEIDLWGRIRRSVESGKARLDASAENRRAVLFSVEAELARDYLRLRGDQELLQILHESLRIAQNNVRLTESRFSNGVTTQLDIANAEADVNTIEATIPPVEAEHDHLLNALSLLLAEPPRSLHAELGSAQPLPVLTQGVPISVPSELLRRRPDIRAAEAELHAATADIGVATADFYPRISLTGVFADEALQLSALGNWGARQLAIGPSISLPLFEGGRLHATLELRRTQQQEAAIHYQKIVLTAWHEADDALIDYSAEQRRASSLRDSTRQNERASQIAQNRYREGVIDFLNVLSVQKSLLEARSNQVRSDVSTYNDLVRLYLVMGGGWDPTANSNLPPPPPQASRVGP
jgi:NodT family efflux transporter outer membrane factor (OMF) lipoprotein